MGNMTLANDAKSVDDVLASIRKLVSDETRARSLEAEKKLAQAAQPAPADPLVLTPELKVASEQLLVLDVPADRPEPAATETKTADPAPVVATTDPVAPFHDEVALRALVSEMIREELQGELGNRITRNVRKLVRREIEQAMKSRSDA